MLYYVPQSLHPSQMGGLLAVIPMKRKKLTQDEEWYREFLLDEFADITFED